MFALVLHKYSENEDVYFAQYTLYFLNKKCHQVLEEDVASPAELAKAYMGRRPSKVSPSLLGLRSQALKEDVTLYDNVPFPSKSPIMSLEPKSAVRGSFPDNGLITPRARGRSAIYSMARTPYSRDYLTANQKVYLYAT